MLDDDDVQGAKEALRRLAASGFVHAKLELLRGRLALLQGNYQEAVSLLDIAAGKMPQNGEAKAFLAAARMSLGETNSASLLAERALSLGYRRAWLLEMLGVAHFHVGRYDDAAQAWRAALDLEPERHFARKNLVEVLAKLGLWLELESHARALLHAKGESARLLAYLGNALDALGEYDAAFELFAKAAQRDDVAASDLRNYAVALFRSGSLAHARKVLERAQAIDMSDPMLDVMSANIDLIENGANPIYWERYERRTALYPEFFHTNSRRWHGQPLATGESLLIYGEQGIGDILLFARWIPAISTAADAPVHFGVPAQLARLMRQTAAQRPDWKDVIVHDQHRPTGLTYSVELPLMSVPVTLQLPVERVSEPYLHVDTVLKQAWAMKLGLDPYCLRVGLVWAGNPAREDDGIRSLPTRQLAALDDPRLNGRVQFIKLQMDARPDYQVPLPLPHVDPTPLIEDFADTAAIISQLNLVISIDTSAAHLAGALGIECWTLLSRMPDWRWRMGDIEQPWFARHRSFKVNRNRDWSQVLADVVNALRNCAIGRQASDIGTRGK